LSWHRCHIPEQIKQVREHDHQPGKNKENYRRMRNLVPDRFNTAEQFLQKRLCFSSVSSIDTTFLCSLMLPALLSSTDDRSCATMATETVWLVANYKSSRLLCVAASAANLQRDFPLKLIWLDTSRSFDRKPRAEPHRTSAPCAPTVGPPGTHDKPEAYNV
jgi:hypothetical protein